jgi:hypothetical protein
MRSTGFLVLAQTYEMEGKFTGRLLFLGVTVTAALCSNRRACWSVRNAGTRGPSASYFGTMRLTLGRIENGLFGRNKACWDFSVAYLFCVPFNYRVYHWPNLVLRGRLVTQTALLASLLGLAGCC